jgi:hypothetical protein
MNQFQKTTEEKEAAKQAKKAYKNNKGKNSIWDIIDPELLLMPPVKKERILTGIMEEEEILKDNYPVFPDYFYVVELIDGTANVIKSDFGGNVRGFINDLKTYSAYKGKYDTVVNIRNCKMGIRNLF